MRALTLEEMAASFDGRIRGSVTVPRVTSVSTDHRKLEPGALFIAIQGERFDGHDFVDQALEDGATAAVVSAGRTNRADGRIIEVENTVTALGRLAAWYRRQSAAQVVAVVGSNGKTTTKDLIGQVLGSRVKGRAAPASYNNEIGVPLTLLSVEPADDFVVVEMGTNHPGEIARLARIALPDMTVVTSIGEEHLEGFGDLHGVAMEEYAFLPASRNRSFVAMSEQAAEFAPTQPLRNRPSLTFGFGNTADLRATAVKHTEDGQVFQVNDRFEYRLPLIGRHNVLNALGAIAIGNRFRLSHEEIAAALENASAPPMRLQPLNIGNIRVLNDAYNANPSSMKAAFQALDDLPAIGRKVVVLGDMRELGKQATRCHQAVGRDAGASTAQVIIAVGAHARIVADGATKVAGVRKRIYAFPTIDALSEKLPRLLTDGDTVLLKASRGVSLEKIIPSIELSVSQGKVRS